MIVKSVNLTEIRRDAIDNSLSSNDIISMFNEFLIRFEQLETSGAITRKIFYDAIEEITDGILLIAPEKLLDSRVLHHPLIHVLHQLLTSLLDKWCMSPLRIYIREMDVFFKIGLIFVQIAGKLPSEGSDQRRYTREDLQATKKFLYKVREQIDQVVLHTRHLDDDRNIYALGLLIIKILEDSPFYYQLGRNERMTDDLVINSLDSYDFIQVFRQLENGKPLTRIEHYLLLTCWQYLSFKSGSEHKLPTEMTSIDLIHSISDALLTQLVHALDEPAHILPHVFSYILERYQKLLNIPNLPSRDQHANSIINYLVSILQISLPANTAHHRNISLVLQTFHNLVNNPHIRLLIRKRHLTSLFNEYASSATDEQTRQLVLSILAHTIDEQDVNKNPTQIIAAFLEQLTQLHPNTHNPHLDTTLSNLKVMMQHEQIKNEFVNQGGLEQLVRFVRDGDPKKQSVQQLEDALKILWSCTFNNPQVLQMLRQDTKFIERVNQLLDNLKDDENSSLAKAAEGVIWKVVKEEKFEQEQREKEAQRARRANDEKAEGGEEEEEQQYDCMISYSWFDMDLAHRIFHHLTDKLGYRVWLDQQQMHGSTIEAMAHAVEGAEFILMCMSESYKQSANCQSEAEYAFKRKKHIIPIKVTEEYVPDGWLGFILGSRMYIDFGKYDFEKAMVLLDNEIQLQKKKRKEVKSMANMHEEGEADENRDSSEETEGTMDMSNLSKWNESTVEKFLRKEGLSDLLPLCEGMNGAELLDLYGMCKSSSVTMYRSLKFELLNNHEKLLPIATFLHFIRRLRVVDDSNLPLSLYIYSEHLAEHSQDDE